MTEQQKADELFNAYYRITCNILDAKECCYVHINDRINDSSTEKKKWWKDVMEIVKNK